MDNCILKENGVKTIISLDFLPMTVQFWQPNGETLTIAPVFYHQFIVDLKQISEHILVYLIVKYDGIIVIESVCIF